LNDTSFAQIVDVRVGQPSNEAMEPVTRRQSDHFAKIFAVDGLKAVHLDAPQFGFENEAKMPVGHPVAVDTGLTFALDDRAFFEAVGLMAILATVVGVGSSGLGEALSAEGAGKRFKQHANLERASAMAALAFLLIAPDGDNFVGLKYRAGHLPAPF
jgi:hypothetical protein